MSGAPPPRSFWRDNSLSLVFGGLLLLTLAGQSVWGVALYNEEARTAELQEISLWRYVTSSGFAVDVAENWQSEFLQFVLYIALTVWLVQRGSSESKKPGDEGRETDEQQLRRRARDARLAGLGPGRGLAHPALLALARPRDGRHLRAVVDGAGGHRTGGRQRGAAARPARPAVASASTSSPPTSGAGRCRTGSPSCSPSAPWRCSPSTCASGGRRRARRSVPPHDLTSSSD